jgi:hypothetical protein
MASSQSDRALRAEAHGIRRALQDQRAVTTDPSSGATGRLPVMGQVPVTEPGPPETAVAAQRPVPSIVDEAMITLPSVSEADIIMSQRDLALFVQPWMNPFFRGKGVNSGHADIAASFAQFREDQLAAEEEELLHCSPLRAAQIRRSAGYRTAQFRPQLPRERDRLALDNNAASEELVRELEEENRLARDPRSNRVYPEDREYASEIDRETLEQERMEGTAA